MLTSLAIHVLLALVLVLIMNRIGRLSRSMGYMTFHEVSQLKEFGFNLVSRILAAPVYISFLAIALYLLDLSSLVEELWLVSVYYMVIQLIIVIILERLGYISKGVFIATHTMSILLSYWLYSASLRHGLEYIIPSRGDFVVELWLIIIIFFYRLLNDLEIDPNRLNRSKEIDVRRRHCKLKKMYDDHLKKEFSENKLLNDFLFSVMIFEDLNRPRAVRFLERLLFPLGLVKTTGLMQAKSTRRLSDLESLAIAQKRILKDYKRLGGEQRQIQEFSGLTYDLAKAYNGENYAQEIESIYWVIKN